ncbi:MAG: cupin domain-containing protein [Acidimicrobiia bacterium]|nr:cupin domain-containing protein [Acidimicrobiia bacterium]NNL29006.1 cupin domain-containing protein [Acidimicrobiia bacterium]
MAAHIVKTRSELHFSIPGEFADRSSGYSGDLVVSELGGAVQMGFRVARLEHDGYVATHVHSFEESLFVIDGTLVVDTPDGSHELVSGDYALFPVGMTHAFRNLSGSPVEFAEMKAPLPRERFGFDTQFPPPLRAAQALAIDVRDPRNRYFGHIDPASMDPKLQTQDKLALSASMRTALLVYSGISVKMMVDSDLGADLSTMFMVQYEPGGFAGAHDHPLEETYLILEGQTEAVFDGSSYLLGPGDVAWAGVGCVHEFRQIGDGVVRWLEPQAPQPPPRHSYRFARDWAYLENALADET